MKAEIHKKDDPQTRANPKDRPEDKLKNHLPNEKPKKPYLVVTVDDADDFHSATVLLARSEEDAARKAMEERAEGMEIDTSLYENDGEVDSCGNSYGSIDGIRAVLVLEKSFVDGMFQSINANGGLETQCF